MAGRGDPHDALPRGLDVRRVLRARRAHVVGRSAAGRPPLPRAARAVPVGGPVARRARRRPRRVELLRLGARRAHAPGCRPRLLLPHAGALAVGSGGLQPVARAPRAAGAARRRRCAAGTGPPRGARRRTSPTAGARARRSCAPTAATHASSRRRSGSSASRRDRAASGCSSSRGCWPTSASTSPSRPRPTPASAWTSSATGRCWASCAPAPGARCAFTAAWTTRR